MNEQLWWWVARASGITSWALATATVLWGLALSTRVLGNKPRGPWLTDLHRFLGGLTVIFVLVHMAGLWLDSFVEFGPVELLVPFTSTWQPAEVAVGVVAFYLLLAVEITSLLAKRISKRLWRGVHFTSYGVWLLGTIHLLTAGTDASNPMLLWSVIISSGAVAFFTAYRVIGPGKASGRPPRTIPNRPSASPSPAEAA